LRDTLIPILLTSNKKYSFKNIIDQIYGTQVKENHYSDYDMNKEGYFDADGLDVARWIKMDFREFL
jgi:hypothetical protein